jgi:hypothetical protein
VQEGAVLEPQRAAAAANARRPAIRRRRGIGATSAILRPAAPARKIEVGMKIGFYPQTKQKETATDQHKPTQNGSV